MASAERKFTATDLKNMQGMDLSWKIQTSMAKIMDCMKPWNESGLGMKEVLDYVNVKTE